MRHFKLASGRVLLLLTVGVALSACTTTGYGYTEPAYLGYEPFYGDSGLDGDVFIGRDDDHRDRDDFDHRGHDHFAMRDGDRGFGHGGFGHGGSHIGVSGGHGGGGHGGGGHGGGGHGR